MLNSWLLLVLAAPLFSAFINYIDKYLVEIFKIDHNINLLTVFSSILGLPVALIIYSINPSVVSVTKIDATFLIVNGMLYMSGFYLYIVALEKEDVSTIAPLFQLSSIVSHILGYIFLGEVLSVLQFLAVLMILLGSLLLTIEHAEDQRLILKKQVFFLMLLSSSIYAITGLIFKYLNSRNSFLELSFWEYLGMFSVSLIFLSLDKKIRFDFMRFWYRSPVKLLALNGLNEIFAVLSKSFTNFALLLSPIALTYFVSEGFQPIYVLVLGVLISKLFPKYISDSFDNKKLLQKAVALCVVLGGTYFLTS